MLPEYAATNQRIPTLGTKQITSAVVIDDDHSTRELVIEALRSEGIWVESASDLGSGLATVLRVQPQVVILDRFVGPDDGLRIIESIQRLSPNSRVLVLSGCASFGTLMSAMSNGADGHLVKPVSCAELRLRVQSLATQSNATFPALRADPVCP
jgi:DNA-binding response OmpR family regulator